MIGSTPRKKKNRVWTNEHITLCVELNIQKKSLSEICASVGWKFDVEKPPTNATFYTWVTKFRHKGTLHNLYNDYEGRQTPCWRPTVRTPQVILAVV